MCRKLETEVEKVLPFYSSSLTPEEEIEANEDMARSSSEPIVEVGIVLMVQRPHVINYICEINVMHIYLGEKHVK